jgi:C_GCAxxG_C_C family probable redox protein
LDWECIPRIATGLGGGVGRQGELCGALTAGVLIVGLVHGRDRAEDTAAKIDAYDKAAQLLRRFAEIHGATSCRDLIGVDLSTDEGVEEYYARNLLEDRCSGIAANAVRVVLELLDEWESE